MRHSKLVDSTTQLQVQSIVCPNLSSIGLARLHNDDSSPCTQLMAEFPAVTQASFNINGQLVKHTVMHHIETTGPAVHGRTHRLAPEHLEIARKEFDHMLQLGVTRPSSSSWAAPLHMVPKRTPGDWHPCGDFLALHSYGARQIPGSPSP